MSLKPRLTAAQAKAGMAELDPAYTPQEARTESERCLYCFDAPCIMACPTGIDIPGFIQKIANGNLAGAGRTIFEANPLGASCARVCPTTALCEGACVMLDRDNAPIKIGRLQRHATDYVMDRGIPVMRPAAQKSGKRVAVIGSGPAGLGCAAELARLGHQVVVFEKKAKPGGLNTYGIAFYKLTPAVSLKEVQLIADLGVEFRCNTEVGKDISVKQLEKQFDAIFVGVGLGRTYRLGIPGEDLPEVLEALDFIEQIHTQPLHRVPLGARVAVVGCGNTAIDAATQAKRLGAEHAVIMYRRGAVEMPAYPYEYEIAKSDGCEFQFHTAPVAVEAERGHVRALRLARTEVGQNGRVAVVPGSERSEPFDMVIKALGQEPQAKLLKALFPGLRIAKDGTIAHKETGQTNLRHVFCGGDAANGGREVVNAVGDGKKAARAMHRFLGGKAVAGPVQATRLGVKGAPVGSGIDRPVRVPELERAYYAKQAATSPSQSQS